MESFQYDDTLPQYVGKLNDVLFKWPLLFTLTDDGIVCILINAQYSLSSHFFQFLYMYMYINNVYL